MALKSLIVFVDPSPSGAARTRYAVRLAAEHDAHLIGVFIAATGWRRNPADGFVTGAVAVREMVERHSLFEREAAAGAIKNFEALAGRERVTFEFRSIEASNADELVRLHSLHMLAIRRQAACLRRELRGHAAGDWRSVFNRAGELAQRRCR